MCLCKKVSLTVNTRLSLASLCPVVPFLFKIQSDYFCFLLLLQRLIYADDFCTQEERDESFGICAANSQKYSELSVLYLLGVM